MLLCLGGKLMARGPRGSTMAQMGVNVHKNATQCLTAGCKETHA